MGKLIKAAAASLAAAGAVFGSCALFCERFMNRDFIFPRKAAEKSANRDISPLSDPKSESLAWLENYGYEKRYISGSRSEKLTGYLMRPEKESDVYVFGIHGYGADGKTGFCDFARYYLSRNVNVFFTDHTASGESGGKYCSFGFRETADCLKWLDYMKDNFGRDIKIILHGISMGAGIIDIMCGDERLPENVKAAVADCGCTSVKEMFKKNFKALIPLTGVIDFVAKKRFGFGFDDINPLESVKRASVPMLFVHGIADAYVPFHMSWQLYEACASKEKDLLAVDRASHAQSYAVGREEYEAKLDEWLEKYVFDGEKKKA